MRKQSIFVAATAFFSFLPCGISREFTDTSGRKIVADIVSYTADEIEIKMGARTFSVPKSKFSKEDQKYIKEWIAKNPTKSGYRFRIFTDLDENFNRRVSQDGAMVQDKLKTRPHNYNIVVYNLSKSNIDDINIRYEIYVNDVVDTRGNRYTALAVGKKKADKLQTIPGKLTKKKIAGDGKVEFEHNFDLHNYVDRDGGRVDQAASDKVIGVRVRVYKGDQLLGEFEDSEDSKRMESAKWQDKKAPKETPEKK